MSAQIDSAHRRLALLIATSEYSDPALRQLRAPGHDATDLAEVLGNRRIGGFAAQTLINARCGELLAAIEDFCVDRSPDDQLLIYLSCHGVLDDRGRLWYAATDTRRRRTAATAVAAGWLNDRLEDCRARSQIVILDCCHSGAFASGAKGQADLALEQRFKPIGRGRIVLTASRGTEYSFEGDHPSGDGVRSVFTKAIVDGLRTGDADRDKDGLITVTDMYHHVYERVRSAEPRQTPELFLYGAEGDVLLAYSVRGAEATPAVAGPHAPPAQPDAIIRVPRTESRREQASEITNEAYEQVQRENAEEQARLRRETQLRRNASRVARALQDHGVAPTELWPGTSRGYREPVDYGDGIPVIHNIEKRSYGPVRGWLIHQQMISPPSTYGKGLTIRYQLGDDGKIYENATPIEHPSNAEMDKIKRYLAYYGAQKGLDRELFRNDDA